MATKFDLKPGADVTLVRRPSGKFDLVWDDDNELTFTDDESHAVLSLTLERRGEWAADPTRARGSFVYKLKQDVLATPSQAVAYIRDALKPLEESGRITLDPVTGVTAKRVRPGRIDPTINYQTPKAGAQTVRPSLG